MAEGRPDRPMDSPVIIRLGPVAQNVDIRRAYKVRPWRLEYISALLAADVADRNRHLPVPGVLVLALALLELGREVVLDLKEGHRQLPVVVRPVRPRLLAELHEVVAAK